MPSYLVMQTIFTIDNRNYILNGWWTLHRLVRVFILWHYWHCTYFAVNFSHFIGVVRSSVVKPLCPTYNQCYRFNIYRIATMRNRVRKKETGVECTDTYAVKSDNGLTYFRIIRMNLLWFAFELKMQLCAFLSFCCDFYRFQIFRRRLFSLLSNILFPIFFWRFNFFSSVFIRANRAHKDEKYKDIDGKKVQQIALLRIT